MNIKHIKQKVSLVFAGISGVILVPALAFAQNFTNYSGTTGGSTLTQTSDLNGLVTKAIGLFNSAIYLIVALAILTFVWNVYQYFIVKDPENKAEASKYVMYSVIGIFVILAFWGLVNIISNTLNINTNPGTLNVGNLIGNITGNTSGTSGSSAGTPNFGSPTSGSSGTGSSIYNTSATNNSGSNFTSSNNSQAAYQQQANQIQSSMQANGCYTSSGTVVNTPNCMNLSSAYTTAQGQANLANTGNNVVGQPNSFYQQATAAQQQALQGMGCVDANGNTLSNSSQCQTLSNPNNYYSSSPTVSCTQFAADGSCIDNGYSNTSASTAAGDSIFGVQPTDFSANPSSPSTPDNYVTLPADQTQSNPVDSGQTTSQPDATQNYVTVPPPDNGDSSGSDCPFGCN
jgi:hypothetical protein